MPVGWHKTLSREHRGQDGDTEDATELTDGIAGTRCLALLLRLDRGERDIGHGGEEQTHPDARDDEGHDQGTVLDGGRGHEAQPSQTDGLQRQAHAHEDPATDAVGQRASDGCHEHRCQRPGQDGQAGFERGVQTRELQELHQQEDGAEHPEAHQHRAQAGQAEGATGEEAWWQHRGGSASLPQQEGPQGRATGCQRAEDDGAGPTGAIAIDERPDDPEETG